MLIFYHLDTFFKNDIHQNNTIKPMAEQAPQTPGLFEQFLNSYPFSVDECEQKCPAKSNAEEGLTQTNPAPAGVCLVCNAGTIKYVNNAGLALLQDVGPSNIIGKNFKDVFLLGDKTPHDFHKHTLQNDLTADELGVRLEDGTEIRMRAGITFAATEDNVQVSGIIFNTA